MAKSGKVYQCFCCGSEVTAPQFYKGKVYGWTCIKKVDPSAKRSKDNGLWVKFDSVEMTQPDLERCRFVPVVTVNGKRFTLDAIYSDDLNRCRDLAVDSKLFKIADHAHGAKPLYKAPVIVTEEQSNGSHIVVDVLINGLSVF